MYDGTVAIDPAARTLHARWHIAFVRLAGSADSVTLLLNEALVVGRLDGADVARYTTARSDGLQRLTLHFRRPAITDLPASLDIEYAGAPAFSSDSINGISRSWIELGLDSFWHPVFADFAHSITAHVRLELPSGWQAATSGSVQRRDGALLLTNDVPLVDIAFGASPMMAVTNRGRTRVAHVRADSTIVARVLETTSACGNFLDARYGARRPLPDVTIMVAPRTGPGYARKNYIVITRGADTSQIGLQRFVCHELAHFWSSGANSSGAENWLNEAFAEYVSARYVRATSGDSMYAAIVAGWRARGENAAPVWRPGVATRPSARTAYGKAPFLLNQLEERIGVSLMDRVLVLYMGESIGTTSALLDVIRELAGDETATWFQASLSR